MTNKNNETNVVINRKTTKFESNSQLLWYCSSLTCSCYQSQNYKIWKQFTTKIPLDPQVIRLLSIAKLQNLKAIHNAFTPPFHIRGVVINRKTTKFESNSQQEIKDAGVRLCCYQSQNYKIWKQFTTDLTRSNRCNRCYQSQNYKIWKQFTTKLTIMAKEKEVVINRKTTKFESNSQQ